MLHIKLKGMKYTTTYKQKLCLGMHPRLLSGAKRSKQGFFLLKIKIKENDRYQPQCVCVCGGGGGGGGVLKHFNTYIGSNTFFFFLGGGGVQNFEFQYFSGVSEKLIFLGGMKILWIFFGIITKFDYIKGPFLFFGVLEMILIFFFLGGEGAGPKPTYEDPLFVVFFLR